MSRRRYLRTHASIIALTLVAALIGASIPAPAVASGSWVVDTTGRTQDEIRYAWNQLKPVYTGTAHQTSPSVTAPYVAGSLTSGFAADGVNMLNFARYLAGLPYDVRLDADLADVSMHGAVLLAASTFSHNPPKPADMTQAFYDRGLTSTTRSNIGSGYQKLDSFTRGCLDDADASNIVRVGHRRWLLNPRMAKAGMGYASGRTTTYVFDTSRSETVDYDVIAWPAPGFFPVEMFGTAVPWSVTLNPSRYWWGTGAKQVTLRRVSDGRTWTFDANDTNTSGEYFNFDTSNRGIANVFVFRPNPNDIAYQAGDAFDVTVSGDIRAGSSTAPLTTIRYRTTFMSLEGAASPPPSTPSVTTVNLGGSDRYETAVQVSRSAFPDGAATVLIATGTNWCDALGGSPLAAAKRAPILLTRPDGLPSSVLAEIGRLGAREAIILGGPSAVSPAVASALERELGAGAVRRLGGADRYETADIIASAAVGATGSAYDGTAFVATGANFPDALAASPLAAAKSWPLFLVPRDRVLPGTASTMRSCGVRKAIILGGTSVVSVAVETQLRDAGIVVERIAGENRYDTAARVASYGCARGLEWSGLAVATGESYPDALAGGVMQGLEGSVMLLTRPTSLPTETKSTVSTNREEIEKVVYLGGTSAVSTTVRAEVQRLLQW